MAELVKIAQGKNYIIYRNGADGPKLIKLENIRFSYPHFGEQRQDERDDGSTALSWGGVAMLPKATHVEAKDAFVKILEEIQTHEKVRIEPQYKCIKNGDDKEDEAMHGHWLISFSTQGKRRPPARDKTGQVIETPGEIDDIFYGGAWGHVLLRPWYFSGRSKKSPKTYPKRLLSGYEGVQFVRDDKPFGSARVDDTGVWTSADDGDGMGGSTSSDDDGL
jgi:hypothetical protein